MINLILILLLNIPTVLALDKMLVKESSLLGTFFYLNHLTLITHTLTEPSTSFGDLRLSNKNRIRKIPVAALESLGLKENDTIHFISFSDGKSRQYTLGKEVFVLLLQTRTDKARFKWGTYNLILSNNPEEHVKIAKLNVNNPPVGNGLAYIGEDFNFTDGQYTKTYFDKSSSSKKLDKLFLDSGKDIRFLKIDDFNLYVDFKNVEPWITPVLSLDTEHYLLEPLNIAFNENNSPYINIGSFSKRYKFLTSLVIPDMECSRLYLVSKNKVYSKSIHCIPENI